MVSWSLRSEEGGAQQPDGLIAQLKELFPKVREQGGMQESGRRTEPVTPQAALDGLGPWLGDLKSGEAEDVPAAWKTALVSLLYSGPHRETMRQILEGLLLPVPAFHRLRPAAGKTGKL